MRESEKGALIAMGSTQETKQRFVSTWAQICSKSVEISVECAPLCAPLCLPRPPPPPRTPRPLLFLLLLTLIGIGIGVVLAAFGFLNDENNFLNNECELECAGALSPNTINTTIIFCPTGGGVGLKNEFGNAARGAGAAQTITTTVAAPNEPFYSGPSGGGLGLNNEFGKGVGGVAPVQTTTIATIFFYSCWYSCWSSWKQRRRRRRSRTR